MAGSASEAEPVGFTDEGRPRYSNAAVIAFILALVLLLPCLAGVVTRFVGFKAWIPAILAGAAGGLLAVVLGIVGIVKTSARRRRGRGLAIAAIPLGVLAALSQLTIGSAITRFKATTEHSRKALAILETPRSRLPEEVSEWYEAMPSARFKVAVTEAQFRQWLEEVQAKHGQLQEAERSKQKPKTRDGAIAFNFVGRFVNGATDIEVLVGLDMQGPRVDDLRVGGSSPLD